MDVLLFVVGVAIVVATASDIFQSVIIPQPTGRRLRASVAIGRRAWATYRFVVNRLRPELRERCLSVYASLLLIAFLGFWVVSLVVGYGLMFFALRAGIKPVPNFFEALYLSATTALTVGFGDFVPTSPATRIIAFFAGASGLAGIAIGTSFLFPVIGAYQAREVFVILIGNRVGRPPSAVRLLVDDRDARESTLTGDLRAAELWLAQLVETHLAYPILTWFRSTDDGISWLAVTETFLDATSLLLTSVDERSSAETEFVQRLGVRFVNAFARYVRIPQGDGGLDAATFDRAYDALATAGYPMREREAARGDFARTRATYAGQIDAISRYWQIPRGEMTADLKL